MRIALDEIKGFLMHNEMLIYLVVFGTNSTKLGYNLYPELEAYIDHNYVCEKRFEEYGYRYAFSSFDKRYIIFSFFIENEIYDIYEIDIALEKYGLQILIS